MRRSLLLRDNNLSVQEVFHYTEVSVYCAQIIFDQKIQA